MRMMFNAVFGAAVTLAMLASAPPGSAQAPAPAAPPKPQRHTFNVQFKIPPKIERKPLRFELVNGRILFRAKINGELVWATLDNAADMSLIDRQFATDHQIAVGPVVSPIITSSGSLERRVASSVPIELPGQASLTGPFSVIDLRFVSMAAGRPVSLVIGREYFSNLTFIISPTGNSIAVGPSGGLKVPPNISFAPIEDDRARVQVDVDGHKLSLLIDLGANGQLLLNPATWTRLGLDKAPQKQGWSADATGKFVDAATATVHRVTIGPFVKDDVVAQRRPTMLHRADGYVGLGFLANFNFAIDVKGRKLWMLAPVKKAASAAPTAP